MNIVTVVAFCATLGVMPIAVGMEQRNTNQAQRPFACPVQGCSVLLSCQDRYILHLTAHIIQGDISIQIQAE